MKFRIWPGQGGPLEARVRPELVQSLRALDTDYAGWMVGISYEVEQKTGGPTTQPHQHLGKPTPRDGAARSKQRGSSGLGPVGSLPCTLRYTAPPARHQQPPEEANTTRGGSEPLNADRSVAYFSMEIAVDPAMPTYSGGLGILAGDTVRAAADLKVPMVAVTLLHRKGYFYQALDASGWQTEAPVDWVVEDFLQELEPRVTVTVSGRPVQLRAWRYAVQGVKGFSVPVLFLDADLPENTPEDRTLTHWLYGGDLTYRLSQEVVLGFGGVRMLRALGHETLERFHMNEGHASLLTLELLDERLRQAGRDTATPEDVDAVRHLCVFTTHTPVPAGHDRFPCELANAVVGHRALAELADACQFEGQFNLTYLALNLSHYVNGVAKRHGEVSQHLFASYVVDSITNGVHAGTWVCPPVAGVFDRHVPGWRE
ncbi:MAG TPA: alpha-glucan family phosphorylase, partial [Deferrisomatales bacterium]|nr:alpha-glucan family phosphorylase [Deferrisomatales bacterium]